MIDLWKRFLRLVLRFLYQIEVHGLANYQRAGDRVLIIANHTSLLDGVLLYAFLPETPTFAINTDIAQNKWFKPALAFVQLFELDPGNPLAIKAIIHYIKQNKKVVIFPEGRITVTGSLMKVYEGTGLIADKSDATILPIAIDGAQYSRWSYMKGRASVRWCPKIRLTILPPEKIHLNDDLVGHHRRKHAARALHDLMYKLVYTGFNHHTDLYSTLLDSAKQFGNKRLVLEDQSRTKLCYQDLILRSILLGRLIAKQTKTGERVGVLLPNVNAQAVLFFALQFMGRIPTMLNFTAGALALNRACKTAQVVHIYSSRAFIKNAKLEAMIAEIDAAIHLIYLEDLLAMITFKAKLLAWYQSKNPKRYYQKQSTDAAAVVLFTSGSEGQPRGVVLSHSNLLANFSQVQCAINFRASDIVFSCLPLFHSFGLNVGFLMPLYSGSQVFLYPSPLHYRAIPELIYNLGATILFGTNTFLKGYARYAHPLDFHTLRYVIAGAEKLHEDTNRLWMARFGKRILQGYGVTETSPVISVNNEMFYKAGTVGRLFSGMKFYLKPVPGIADGGQLMVQGANVMQGYLRHDNPGVLDPPSTERGAGWYDTGDIVAVDEEGYLTILGRAKRFAKIGGEMVSLTAVEELAQRTWPNQHHAAVATVDPHRGEHVILFTEYQQAIRKPLQMTAKANHISELIIPKTIRVLAQIPVLGTGKTDYVRLAKMVEIETMQDD